MGDPTAGPRLVDVGADAPVASCRGCPAQRVHDWHYNYCRRQGDQTKPDAAYTCGWHRVWWEPDCGLPVVEDRDDA